MAGRADGTAVTRLRFPAPADLVVFTPGTGALAARPKSDRAPASAHWQAGMALPDPRGLGARPEH